MKRELIIILSLSLFSCGAAQNKNPAKPQIKTQLAQNSEVEIVKTANGISIRVGAGAYLYFFKEKQALFLSIDRTRGGGLVIVKVKLDEADKPEAAFVRVSTKDGKKMEVVFDKSTPYGKEFLEKAEAPITWFIEKYQVKKILRENGVQ